jgi:ribosome biogenesis GTPase
VLDTPGVRAVGLLDAGAGLARTFGDVAALVAACRFPDCAHRAEPGCAVRVALASGALSPRRWESWCRLRREVTVEGRRRQVRLDAQERARRRPEDRSRLEARRGHEFRPRQ